MEKRISTVATLSAPSFSVYLDEVRLKTGEVTKRIRVDHPEAAAVVPFVSDKEILMVRQYRYALGRETLEIPAGKADPGESVRACASRELEEETGMRADELILLNRIHILPAYTDELIHVYLARGLRLSRQRLDPDEVLAVEHHPPEALMAMIADGRITDALTILALQRALAYMKENNTAQALWPIGRTGAGS